MMAWTAIEEELIEAVWPPGEPPPKRNITCRHCHQKNRVEVPTAVLRPDGIRCGSCHRGLFLGRDEPLTRIAPGAYEHGLDRKSREALEAVPGFPAATRWLLKTVSERSLRQTWMATHVLCSDEQFPELLALMDQARLRLDIPYRPTVFLGESPTMNAMTMGVEDPMIVVRSALLDQMTDGEVETVFAHELGHLHSDHGLYRTLAWLLLWGGAALGGWTRLVTFPLQAALLEWSRCSELTADRAGLLGSRDLAASLFTMIKFAGGNRPGTRSRTRLRLGPFVAQARELADMEGASWLDSTIATLITLRQTHPFAAWRVLHLLRWVERGTYLPILAGHYAEVKREDETSAPTREE